MDFSSLKAKAMRPVSSWLHYPVVMVMGGLIAFLIVLGWLRHVETTPGVAVGKTILAKPSKEVASVPKVSTPVAGGKVKTYPATVKDGLKLPKDVIDDKLQQVTASTQIKGDEHPHTLTAVVDTATGESVIYDRADPLPWLAWDTHGEAGMYAGLKNIQPAVRLEGRQGLFSIKAVHVQAIGSVDMTQAGQASSFVGIGAVYRW